MFPIAIFIYNIFLIILYALAMSLALNFYFRERKKIFLVLTIFLLFFILDNIIIYMTEFLLSFASTYNHSFMSTPVFKTIIYIVNNYCSFLIINLLQNKKMPQEHYVLLIIFSLWLLMIPMMPNSAVKVWLYYLPNQLLMIYMGVYTWRRIKETDQGEIVLTYLKWTGILLIISGIFILMEDTFVIFNVDQYSSLSIKMNNRNLCEDIFSILACLLMMKYFFVDSLSSSNQVHMEKKESQVFAAFACHYRLTEREKEICQLVLQNKKNQDIASEIYLSIGTVKTHVHNIFIKLNVSKRSQVLTVYQQFTKELNDQQGVLN